MKTYKLMQDRVNGIGPVVVIIPNEKTVKEDTDVRAIYPLGWEEYNGYAVYGRFVPFTEYDILAKELIKLRTMVTKIHYNQYRYIRICQNCEKHFTTKVSNTVYCSEKCRAEARKERAKLRRIYG